MSGSVAFASRRGLVAYFSTLDASTLVTQSNIEPAEALSRLQPESFLVEFDQEQPQQGILPIRIVVREDELEDFFAWSTTYVELLRPITAFIEVRSYREARAVRERPSLSQRQHQGLIAAVLMDALLQSKARPRVPDAILPASQRTLSGMFYQTTLAGSEPWEIADAASLWTRSRSALSAPDLTYDMRYIMDFWSAVTPAVLRSGSSGEDTISRTVARSATASSRDFFWQGSTPEPLIDDMDRFFKASREERIRFVDERIRRTVGRRQSNPSDGAYAGYLLSLVADGDFALWPTAVDIQQLPTCPFWFAFFTGVHEKSNVLMFSQSIGRRLLKYFGEPTYDVDIDAREFLVGRRGNLPSNPLVDFPLMSQHVVTMRLAQRVRGWFPVREVASGEEKRREASSKVVAATDSRKTAKDLIEARHLAERIVRLLGAATHSDVNPQSRKSQTRTSQARHDINTTAIGASFPRGVEGAPRNAESDQLRLGVSEKDDRT